MSKAAAEPVPPPPELWVVALGSVEYDRALELQHRLRERRKAGAVPDVLLLLEHPPVYTCGRRSESAELPMGADWYAQRGIAIRAVDRGGKVTYHGPGQLVGYPILDTAIVGGDVPRLVGTLEAALVDALRQCGVAARPDAAGRGVWAGGGPQAGKIASIGLHIAGGVTTHGFAVNVDNDLAPFGWIKPCGLDDPATSLAERLGPSAPADLAAQFAAAVTDALARRLGLRARPVSPAGLAQALDASRSGDGVADDLVLAR